MGSYAWPTTSGIVAITDGWNSGFGTTAPQFGFGGGSSYNYLDWYGPAAGQGKVGFRTGLNFDPPPAIGSSSGIGEFVFQPQGNNVTSFTSVGINNFNPNFNTSVDLQLWSGYTGGGAMVAEFVTLLEPGGVITVCASGCSVVPNVSGNFSAFSQSALAGGFRFEWGSSGAVAGGDWLRVDNLVFQSEIVPEPGTLALLGTGLIGLAPLMLRRRRRKA